MFRTQLKKVAAVLSALAVTVLNCGLPASGRQTPAPPRGGEPASAKQTAPTSPKTPAPDPLPVGAVAQFGSPRLQDFTGDHSATFSPDGKRLATAGSDTNICVWDVASGALVRTYATRGSVWDLRWKSDGQLAALTVFGDDVFLMQAFGGGTTDLTPEEARRLDDEANRLKRRPAAEDNGRRDRLNHFFLSADGRQVVAVWFRGAKNTRWAAVYRFVSAQTSDTAKAECELALPDGYGVWLSGDGKSLLAHVLLSADGPNKLRAFDLTAAKDRDKPAWELTFPGPQQARRPAYCFSPDGKQVVILFGDNRVELWDGPGGKRLRELSRLPVYNHQGYAEWGGIDLSRDGKRLALIGRGATGEVSGRVVDMKTGRDVCRLAPRPLPRSNGTFMACLSGDGKRLARVGSGVVGIWDAETGADACPLPGHRGLVNSLAVTAGGKQVVTSGEDLTVRAWNVDTCKEVWRQAFPQVMQVKFAIPDGTVVVQEEREWASGRLSLCLDAATGRRRPLPGQLAQAKQDVFLACSPDGKQVLTLDAGKKPAFRVWSWPAGELRTTAPVLPPRRLGLAECRAAHFTPNSRHFAAVMYYSDPAEQQAMRSVPDHPFVETWDPAAGELLDRTELTTRDFPVLMPHPGWLSFWGKDAEVRDVVTGRSLVKLRLPEERGLNLDWIRLAALSPDGRTVAVGCGFSDDHLLLFETRTGRFRALLPVQRRSVTGLSFLPDGRLVSLGTTAIVWSVGLQPAAAAKHDLAVEWERLGDPNPERAWPAMRKLAAAPAEAVRLIRGDIRAVPKVSDESLRRIFLDLDADEFKVREAASKALDRLGPLCVARVKARVAEGCSLETKRRLTSFLALHDRAELSPKELRALRAVEILEVVSTPAAQKLLSELAEGNPDASLTRDAAAALHRIGRR